jgi:uncharacterized membrane protein YphA (DoxX/SURF4 family)
MTKKDKIIYWVSTGLFAAFMLFTAIPDVINSPQAVEFMTKLGYPLYFTPFIGVAKVLGAIAILIPGFPRIKEWAYAGLCYDLIGAAYSIAAMGEMGGPVFILVVMIPGAVSYIWFHKMLKQQQK